MTDESDSDDEPESNLKTEISATVDDKDVGELEVFDFREVETSVDTVDYNHENHEEDDNHDSRDELPLHIETCQTIKMCSY